MIRNTSTPIKAALVLVFFRSSSWPGTSGPARLFQACTRRGCSGIHGAPCTTWLHSPHSGNGRPHTIPGPPLRDRRRDLRPVPGTIYTVVGSAAGAAIAFLLARFLGRDFVESMVGKQVVICCECSEALLTRVIFFSRLLPLISFDVVSYGAGLTRMSLRNFILATILGFIPMTFIYHISDLP